MENLASYSHLIRSVDKSAVLDIGAAYTKCGLSGKHAPRYIIPTRFITGKGRELFLRYPTQGTDQEWKESVEIFLREVFVTRMGLGRGYKIVVLDSLLYPLPFRKALLFVLLNRFRFSAVKFLVAEAMPLFAIPPKGSNGLFQTGLIVDIGYRDTRVLPVYDGVALTGKLQQGGASSFDVLQRLRSLLLEFGIFKSHNGETRNITIKDIPNNVIENIFTQICFACSGVYSSGVCPLLQFPPPSHTCFDIPKPMEGITEDKIERESSIPNRSDEMKRVPSISISLDRGNSIEVDGFIRGHCTDVLFENTEDYPSVAAKILDALLACEVDMRSELGYSIVLCGGICSLPGIVMRVLEECEKLFKLSKYSSISSLAGKLNFYSSPHSPMALPWVGSSMLGSLQSTGITVTLEESQEKKGNCLPNWTSKVFM